MKDKQKYVLYEDTLTALRATDEFYASQSGFQYTEEYVVRWLSEHVKLPNVGRVLDLCCGDGIWSRGFQLLNDRLELYGIDISKGGIEKAKTVLGIGDDNFIVGDSESQWPFGNLEFELIFARGPGLYNQHSMDRYATRNIIEMWHSHLAPRGLFYSIFSSDPANMGTYTSMENAILPYNRSPRKTNAVDFRGGKYHHTIESFLTPFWKARNVDIVKYSFIGNLHILITRLSYPSTGLK